jgi:hypothetical protein
MPTTSPKYLFEFQKTRQRDQLANTLFQEQMAALPDFSLGCIVTGFPMSIGQMQFIQSSIYQPKRIFILNYPEDKEEQVMQEMLTQNELSVSVKKMRQIYH